MFTEQEWPMAKRVHHDTHAECSKLSQLLHNHVLTKCGLKARVCGVTLPDHCHLSSFALYLQFHSHSPYPPLSPDLRVPALSPGTE